MTNNANGGFAMLGALAMTATLFVMSFAGPAATTAQVLV